MELIVWRHADAVHGGEDLRRGLTDKGQQQAQKMAAWLSYRLPKVYRVIVSEARRTRETAAYLTSRHEVLPELNPGAPLEQVLEVLAWPRVNQIPTVLVGHQPYLGCLIAQLLTGKAQPWHVKKSALWWLSHRQFAEAEQSVFVKAMLCPAMLA